MEIITCNGVKIPVDPNFIHGEVADRLRAEKYEQHEVAGMRRFLTDESRVLELGAGIGFTSCYMANELNVPYIACVEANPALCTFMAQVHHLNGVKGAHIVNAIAISDNDPLPHSGMMPFYLRQKFTASSRIPPRNDPGTEIQVKGERLSKLIRSHRADAIVADIEGSEVLLFQDVDLRPIKHVFLELHTRMTGKVRMAKVFDDLHAQGLYYNQFVSRGAVVLFSR